jgi:hypothetical protein
MASPQPYELNQIDSIVCAENRRSKSNPMALQKPYGIDQTLAGWGRSFSEFLEPFTGVAGATAESEVDVRCKAVPASSIKK